MAEEQKVESTENPEKKDNESTDKSVNYQAIDDNDTQQSDDNTKESGSTATESSEESEQEEGDKKAEGGNSEDAASENDDDTQRAIEESQKIHDQEIADPLDAYKVLVIDDDRWMQRIFSQYLKTWGMTHLAAPDSFKGLELALKEKPLMIFLDIVMPDVTGDITIKFLKHMELTKDIPVVIISGNLNKEVLKNTYKDGAQGFITKPFTKEVLQEKISTSIDKKIIRRMIKDGLIAPSVATKKYLAV